MGALLRDLAVKHDLIGHAWYVGTPTAGRIIKDLHPFRMADPISMSQLSWVMQLFYALHIGALAAIPSPRRRTPERLPRTSRRFRSGAILPSASKSDHGRCGALVVPYMLRPPETFDQRDLVAVLRGNPITQPCSTFARPNTSATDGGAHKLRERRIDLLQHHLCRG